jgi:hypothetical protein
MSQYIARTRPNGDPIVTFSQYNAVDPHSGTSASTSREFKPGASSLMSIKKVRVALLWASMVAAMVLSSGVASASGSWG